MASIIQVFVIVVLLVVGWLNFQEKTEALEKRIAALETEMKVMAPLSNVMKGYRPDRATPDGYQAVQATGAPNVVKPGADNALAWCPAQEDGGEEWLELGFETPVAASEIHIHASFNPGAVVRVLGAPEGGEWTELWAGEGSPDAMPTLAVSPARELQRLRLELDTGKVPGWNEIDAVALIDSDGSRH